MTARIEPILFVVGLGLMIPGHITAQATEALLRCDEVYSIVREPPRLWVPSGALASLKIIDALNLYVEGRLRVQNYDYVAQTIIKALRSGRNVGYVTYGNPMMYDRVAQNLVVFAKESGLRLEIVPGISTIDTILCDLNVDMAPGMQVYDASWLLVCAIKPIVYVPAVLMQVGSFGSLRTQYTERKDGRSLKALQEYLWRFYPRTHGIVLVRSTGEKEHLARVRRLSLEQLCDVTAEDLSGASLYIPASEEAPFEEELARKMESE